VRAVIRLHNCTPGNARLPNTRDAFGQPQLRQITLWILLVACTLPARIACLRLDRSRKEVCEQAHTPFIFYADLALPKHPVHRIAALVAAPPPLVSSLQTSIAEQASQKLGAKAEFARLDRPTQHQDINLAVRSHTEEIVQSHRPCLATSVRRMPCPLSPARVRKFSPAAYRLNGIGTQRLRLGCWRSGSNGSPIFASVA